MPDRRSFVRLRATLSGGSYAARARMMEEAPLVEARAVREYAVWPFPWLLCWIFYLAGVGLLAHILGLILCCRWARRLWDDWNLFPLRVPHWRRWWAEGNGRKEDSDTDQEEPEPWCMDTPASMWTASWRHQALERIGP